MDIERLKVDREYWDEVDPFKGNSLVAVYYESGLWEWTTDKEIAIRRRGTKIPRPEPRQVELEVPDAEGPTYDETPQARMNELGNQVHNLGCELQSDEEVSEELGQISTALWRMAKRTKEQREREGLAQMIWKYGENLNITKARKAANAILSKYNLEPKP